MRRARRAASLRATLLRWLLVPLVAVVAAGAVSAYRNAVAAANLAYDRSLLASARAIADRVGLAGGRVTVDVPYGVTDIFEADIPGRLYYKVGGLAGEFVSGYDDFPPMPPGTPRSEVYPALVHFYNAQYRGAPLRAAALFQPVGDGETSGMIVIQVGETLEARRLFARNILIDTVTRQSLLVVLATVCVLFAVRRGLRPLLRLGAEVAQREPGDLRPFDAQQVQREMTPLARALNQYSDRLQRLLESRRRFIADASHQLRTPLAALKTQSEMALRADSPDAMREAVRAIHDSTDETVRLANQLLSLARAEPGATRSLSRVDLTALARQVCLDRAPDALRRGIDLAFEGELAMVSGDSVLLREAIANLLDNALHHTPAGGTVMVRVRVLAGGRPRLEVEDSGKGIPADLRQRVFERFYRVPGQTAPGTGLGLAIVKEIAEAHGAAIELEDARPADTQLPGLRVALIFPP
jgi:two-component system sensor histidine kinase TctE